MVAGNAVLRPACRERSPEQMQAQIEAQGIWVQDDCTLP